MACFIRFLLFYLLCFFLFFQKGVKSQTSNAESIFLVNVGVVLDLNTTVGAMADKCISMARSDFYAAHSDYKTRLHLHTRNADDVIGTASAALDLIKNKEVHAIIGPQRLTQAKFLIELGEKAHIPIISFSAKSPSLFTTQNPFFIRTTPNGRSQVHAIASIVQAYGWYQVILIYENTEYGNGLIPYLADAFQKINTRISYRYVIPPSSSDLMILKKLNKLISRQTRVFLVHTTASLGSRLFDLAKEANIMCEGYAWIITDELSMLLDTMGEDVVGDSMQGVLGIRQYIPMSRNLEDFKLRWKHEIHFDGRNGKIAELNPFGLWAYDTVWALAMAAEMGRLRNSDAFKQNFSRSTHDFSGLRVSEIGPRLLNMLSHTKFTGLSGNFHLVERQLKSSAFEIINVRRKGARIIGYWTPKKGFSHRLSKLVKVTYLTSVDELKAPTWPGDTKTPPKGWVIPVSGRKLKIGVPMKPGFQELLKVEWDPHTNEPIISGFCYDLFLAALDILPFAVPHKFIPFVNSSRQMVGTYDELLYQIKLQKFDAVVGDVSITSNRSLYVDFTLPYIESDVTMVVKIKENERKNIWIFLKPLSWQLWLTIVVAFISTGLVVWILEHRTKKDQLEKQLGEIFWFSFSILVFAHWEKAMNNWSKFVLIIWVFVVLILTQSYTANLASLLTVERIQPAVVDIHELQRNGDYVGYERGSFVKNLLTGQFNFNESKLKDYGSADEYNEALSKGSHNGGVTAIVEGKLTLKLFLAKYCDKYTMTGPTYKTDGLGFAFAQGSPLLPYFSRAILNVTQEREKMESIKRKYFLEQTTCQCQAASISPDSLSVNSFVGLFIIMGTVSASSLLIYIIKFFYLHPPAIHNSSNSQNFSRPFNQRIEPITCSDEDETHSTHSSITSEDV